MKYDFCGYATKNDLKCSDGRIIRQNAFKDDDGMTVPLVWSHCHNEPTNVLGHALLENRDDGVYAYGVFNDTEPGKHAKVLVDHGDVKALSIFANRLVQNGANVTHGCIREVSLVYAGANPGAYIEARDIEHSDLYLDEDEAVLYTGEYIEHADNSENDKKEKEEEKMADEKGKTVKDVVDTMTEEQKSVMYYLIGLAAEEAGDEEDYDEEDYDEEVDVKHNAFDATETDENSLSHDEMAAIFEEARNTHASQLSDVFLAHGITNLDVLLPDAKLVSQNPEMIARPNTWVSEVWNAVKKSPFARIKSVAADVTKDDARAKGYVKGKKKVEEVVSLLKRTTTPQMVYKLQGMDREDVIDITDIDIVAWLKAEMRMMLDEELARAIMVGDGRSVDSNDKIKTDNIRPIYGDSSVYTIYRTVTTTSTATREDRADALIDQALLARKDYMGSGNPVFYAPTDVINDMLLARDKIGHRMYRNLSELAEVLRVQKIVEIPVMEGVTRIDADNSNTKMEVLALIVNLSDYTVGADKGGAVTLFDDFNIDYNKYQYLIETRCSGALTKPYSAIALEKTAATTPVTPPTQGTEVQG